MARGIRPRHRRSAAVLALAALAFAPAAGAQWGSVAFTELGGLPLLEARVGADPVRRTFVLDTGARPCVLDAGLVATLGLATGGQSGGRGGAGDFSAELVSEPPALALDGLGEFRCRETLAADLGGVSDAIGRRIDGVIGSAFFLDAVVRIDYDALRITRSAREQLRPPRHATRIALEIERDRPYLRARLSAGALRDVERLLLVDTGSMDAIADELIVQAGVTHGAARATGLGGGAPTAFGLFDRVAIGPLEFERVTGTVPQVAIVGAGLLRRFNLVFDYGGGALWLQERRESR